jgi:hypothetical protein
MTEGRDPTVHELSSLADRIRTEVRGTASAFAWGGATDDGSVHMISLRLAQAALIGHASDVQPSDTPVLITPVSTPGADEAQDIAIVTVQAAG